MISLSTFFSSGVSANDDERKIRKLEERIEKLEQKLKDKNSLKVKDYQGAKVQGSTMSQISPEQIDKIKKQVEKLRLEQVKRKKYLDELMREN